MNARQFLENIAEHGILAPADVSQIRDALSPEQLAASPEAVARDLVRQGKLTRYQALNVYQGRAKTLVFDEYVVLDKIGAGGMGQVFKARHRRMKRIVALKLLPANATLTPSSVERFYKEVELAARLSHPNIVTAFDAGEARGQHYLVMEYIEGQDLSTFVRQNGPLSVEQAMNCIAQAAQGLVYAHAQGIVHRDVKPSNLMVDRHGKVKILDLGLARVEMSVAAAVPAGDAELTISGQVLGTVDYMAPEQSYDSRSVDHRADIYSLGCTLFRLLIGQAPYAGETMVQKLLAHREQPIPSLRALRPEVTPGLDALFQRMVAKSPDDRPASMQEVVLALETLLSGAFDDEASVSALEEAPPADDLAGSFLNRLADAERGTAAGGEGSGSTKVSPRGDSSITQVRPAPEEPESLPQIEPLRRHRSAAPAWLPWAVGAAVLVLGIGLSVWVLQGGAGRATARATADAKSSQHSQRRRPAVTTAPNLSTAPADRNLADNKPVDHAPSTPATPQAEEPAADGISPPIPDDTPAPPTPDNTSASSPDKPEKLTGPVNLLERVDLTRDAWTDGFSLDAAGLYHSPNELASLHLPIEPPDEYDLTVSIDDAALFGQLRIGLWVQGRPTSVWLNRQGGLEWGLELADPTWPCQRAVPLPSGPLTIVCAVRRDRVYVTFNGRAAIDWSGGPTTPELKCAVAGIDSRLFLQLSANYRVNRIEISPPTLQMPRYARVDLLAELDPKRDRTSGEVSLSHGDLLLDQKKDGFSGANVTVQRPSEYVVTAVVERKLGWEHFYMGLPVGGTRMETVIDHESDELANFDDPPGGHASPHLLLMPWRLHTIVYTVRGNPAVRVQVDGREIARYGGASNVPDAGAFAVASYKKAAFRIRRLELAPLGWRKPPLPTDELVKARAALASAIDPPGSAGKTTDEKLARAAGLWRDSARAASDPPRRYVLLDAAAHLAAEAGDLSLTCHLAIDMARAFEGDLGAWYTKLFGEVFKTAKTTPQRYALAIEAWREMELAMALEEFEVALGLQAAASTVKPLPTDLAKELKTRNVELKFWRDEQAAAAQAQAELAADPALREANLAAGRYVALVRGDWAAALTHLDKSGDSALAAAVGAESQSRSGPGAATAAGDLWWALSIKAAAPLKWWYMERAAHWYRQAAAGAAEKNKAPLSANLRQLTRQRKSSGLAFAPRHPADAVKLGERWYKYCPTPVLWQTANAICRAAGGTLPMLKTPDDNQAVIQVLMSAPGGDENRTTWLGLSDEEKEGEFRWLDGTPLAATGFTNWAGGQPNNANGKEDAVAIRAWLEGGVIKSHWDDVSGSAPSGQPAGLPFICVWED